MRIALAQLNPTSGDIEGNTAKVLAAIAEASARGADLLVTPEMVIPGYCIGDLVEDAGFLAANERAIARVAAKPGLDRHVVHALHVGSRTCTIQHAGRLSLSDYF